MNNKQLIPDFRIVSPMSAGHEAPSVVTQGKSVPVRKMASQSVSHFLSLVNKSLSQSTFLPNPWTCHRQQDQAGDASAGKSLHRTMRVVTSHDSGRYTCI